MGLPEIFRKRKSVRKFKSSAISDRDITTILEAARLAPTARNVQPWEFIVIKDGQTRKEMARLAERNAPFIAQAPVCIAVFCQDTKYYLEDGSAATTNALLCAAELGLGACWVAGDKKEYAQGVAKLLAVPDGYKLVSLIALGEPVESPAPAKRPLGEMVHKEKY